MLSGENSDVCIYNVHNAAFEIPNFLRRDKVKLDYVDAIPRFEIDLDSYLQLGGANAVRAEANRQRVLLRKLLESQDFVALQ